MNLSSQNIDTDQIIPAEYLTLVPSKPDEYEKLGSYAMIGLPDDLYPSELLAWAVSVCNVQQGIDRPLLLPHAVRFVEEGQMKTKYPVIIGGENFGCGSSREHAPVSIGASGKCPSGLLSGIQPDPPLCSLALRMYVRCASAAAGTQVVVAQSYARIFFRNCISTGELYPVETELRLCDELKTGDEVEVDMVRPELGRSGKGACSCLSTRHGQPGYAPPPEHIC